MLKTKRIYIDWLNAIDGLTVKAAIEYMQKLDQDSTLFYELEQEWGMAPVIGSYLDKFTFTKP